MKSKYFALGILLIIIILLVVFRNKLSILFPGASAAPAPSLPPSGNTNSSTASGMDPNKLLKKGVTGFEVKQLQSWLGGIDVDGDFGPATEARLLEVKGVKEVTLSMYGSLSNAIHDTLTDSGSDSESWFSYIPYGYIFN